MHTCPFTCTHVHSLAHMSIHVRACPYTCTHVHTHAHMSIRVHTHAHMSIHKSIHLFSVHMFIRTSLHLCKRRIIFWAVVTKCQILGAHIILRCRRLYIQFIAAAPTALYGLYAGTTDSSLSAPHRTYRRLNVRYMSASPTALYRLHIGPTAGPARSWCAQHPRRCSRPY